jgi:hypothetical protein
LVGVEYVIQKGVQKAWQFLQERLDYAIGYYLRQLPSTRQQEYRDLVQTESPSIFMGYPQSSVTVPSFGIVLMSEDEDPSGQYIGDAGPSFREMPYPAVAEDDYLPEEEFDGLVYGDHEQPKLIEVDGELGTREVYAFSPRRKNLWQQRHSHQDGDEQHDQMGQPPRLWHRDRQRLGSHAVGDRVRVGILVTTDNPEKTMTYYRLLRWILRRFKTWFEKNGVIDPNFSGRDLLSSEALFQRAINVDFVHIDMGYQVESVLEEWMFEVEMLTQKPDGSYDAVPLFPYQNSAEDDEDD